MLKINYKYDLIPTAEQIIRLYEDAELNRPTGDPERIRKMYLHSNLIITAWHQDELIGVARSLTDFCYSCYLSDLAVMKKYQKQGVGKTLIELTKEKTGTQSMLHLHAAPAAMEYYPKIGMLKAENSFMIRRLE